VRWHDDKPFTSKDVQCTFYRLNGREPDYLRRMRIKPMGFACKSEANVSQYCNREVERLLDQQSQELDTDKRKALVWQIERILVEDVARPIIFHDHAATCWHFPRQGPCAA
jgi:ABC-type transport system substrate-binding protein